jgi:hypothetical protein
MKIKKPLSNSDITRRETNNKMVEALERFEREGKIGSQRMIDTYKVYEGLQRNLKGVPDVKTWHLMRFGENKECCDLCKYPVTSTLTKTHINPTRKWDSVNRLIYVKTVIGILPFINSMGL